MQLLLNTKYLLYRSHYMASQQCVLSGELLGNFLVKTLHHTSHIYKASPHCVFLMIYKSNFERNHFITLITFKWLLPSLYVLVTYKTRFNHYTNETPFLLLTDDIQDNFHVKHVITPVTFK